MHDNSVDMIFADPPYDHSQLVDVPDLIFATEILHGEGILILEHQQTVKSVGDYRFYVVPGDYLVAVFIDVNRDGVYQQGEHGNYHLDPLMVTVQVRLALSLNGFMEQGTSKNE